MKPTVLIVDDEAGVRSALSGVLRDEGYNVDAVDSGEACLDRASRAPYDVIVLDIWLPGIDGLATLERLRERRVDAPVVMISGHGNIESAVRAIKLGAFDFVEKPLSLEKTVLVVGNAVRQRRLEAENRALRAHVDKRLTMVGESYVMAQLREQVAMAAPTNGRVLIFGENGTGKELVARITIADNGPGIPPADRDKLFMPYYSTKRRGSGLGLAIVRRIIAEHGGNIEVTDNVPHGSRFVIELPV